MFSSKCFLTKLYLMNARKGATRHVADSPKVPIQLAGFDSIDTLRK
jgi:hypothetical protein